MIVEIVDIDIASRRAGRAVVVVTLEAREEIIEAEAEVVRDGVFDTATDCPAPMVAGDVVGISSDDGVQVALGIGCTSGCEDQGVVEGNAPPDRVMADLTAFRGALEQARRICNP